MKLFTAAISALVLVPGLAIAGDRDGDVQGCPDYRMDGERVIEVCDPDKLAEGDFLSPTDFAQGFGGALTSSGGSDGGASDSSSQ